MGQKIWAYNLGPMHLDGPVVMCFTSAQYSCLSILRPLEQSNKSFHMQLADQ